MSPLIELQGVEFGYGNARPVLRSVDLALQPGERLALNGPNGCGKTTLLHVIMGLLLPHTGTVRVFGRERRTEADFQPVRGRVGLLFQDADDQLFCPTVKEDLAFGPLNLGRPAPEVLEIVRRTLALTGLEGYEDRLCYRLSVGEKRLVALATVLAMEPEVLLLDEPTAGLDEATRERVIELLGGLRAAMIIVSHDPPCLERLGTRSVWLRDGVAAAQ